MEKGKLVSIIATALFVVVISIFSFSFNHTKQMETEPNSVSANENTEKNKDGSTNSGDSAVTNNVDNDINGDNVEVNNTINNNIKSSDNNNVDNNINNHIDVNVDVKVNNNVENHMEGQDGGSGDDSYKEDPKNDPNGKGEDSSNDDEVVWGVDSASLTTSEMLTCVRENFGTPEIWGRYLGEKEGVSTGLTSEEVKYLHSNDIKILVIWNHFTDATGYENGKKEAEEAIAKAKELSIPEGVAIFADIEPGYPVDSEFIKGWSEVIAGSNYSSGIYGIFDSNQDLYKEFEEAATNDKGILENTYLWTASPNVGITTEANAPEYQPEGPKNSLVSGWQYGIDAKACNIDTNLFKGNLTKVVW